METSYKTDFINFKELKKIEDILMDDKMKLEKITIYIPLKLKRRLKKFDKPLSKTCRNIIKFSIFESEYKKMLEKENAEKRLWNRMIRGLIIFMKRKGIEPNWDNLNKLNIGDTF